MTAAQSRVAAMAIVAITIAASALAYMSWRQSQVDAFAASAKAALANVDLVLDRALLTVRAVQGLYIDNPGASEHELARFVEAIGPVAGLRALTFEPRIAGEDRAEFEAELRRTGRGEDGIWKFGDDRSRQPMDEEPEYYPVAAIYAFQDVASAYGLDIRSMPQRRVPIDLAIRSGAGTSTEIVDFLTGETTPVKGLIFYKPVVVDGTVIGIVSGSIEVDNLIAAAKSVSADIRDIDITIGPLVPADDAPVESMSTTDRSKPFVVVNEQNHSGRVWTVRVSGTPGPQDYARGYGLMTLVLLAGLGAAASVNGYSTAARRGRELRSAETRLRRTLDGLVPLVFMTDTKGRVITANRAALDTATEAATDSAADSAADGEPELVGRQIDDLPIWDRDRANMDALHLAIIRAATGEERRLDVLSTETGFGQSVYDVSVRPVAVNGEISQLVVSALDVSERVEAAETERLLMRELDHRMKNTLQVVQGVVRRTARSHDSVDTFEAALLGRITTMARAHDLLARERWLGADLRTIVLQEIQPFEHGHSITVTGAPIRINPKGALAFALAMHELGTNAIKYGALSVADGRLEIDWAMEGNDDDRQLAFRWKEFDGPRVAKPERRGFGSLLLERSITYDLDGETFLDFAPEGVYCRITIPWDRLRPMTASIHFRERLAGGIGT
jgi:two-component sensor histidine kinase/CHASE1-domain containing sensor protein